MTCVWHGLLPCDRAPDDSLTFYFHEHDNNTETNLHNLYRKYAGYLAFHKERRFPDLLRRFLNKHGISIPDTLIARADFRVLTTAPDAHRRDKLIREVNSSILPAFLLCRPHGC